MRKFYICFSAVLLFLAIPSFAEVGPADVVKTAAAEVKSQRSPLPLLEHIHWPTVYSKMTTKRLGLEVIQSPDALKQHFRKIFSNPASYVRNMMRENLKQVPADKRYAIENQISGMIVQVENQYKDMRQRIARTSYSVTDSKVNGNAAVVTLVTTTDGEQKVNRINLQKFDDRWFLTSPQFANASAGQQQRVPSVPTPSYGSGDVGGTF